MSILTYPLTPNDLPFPASQQSGWWWGEKIEPFPQFAQLSRFPPITIVTPSYNQGQFLEATIRSILLQGYPNLEYIIIDGGSDDNTLEIIRQYEPFLAYWISEPDGGQSEALNKGFKRATGELIGWQNSDDTYAPYALWYAAQTYLNNPHCDVIYGEVHHIDEQNNFIKKYPVIEATVENMIPYSSVSNHSVFYHRKIFENQQWINSELKHCMDQEFHLRLLLKGYQFIYEPRIIGHWRIHEQAKSTRQLEVWSTEAFQLCKLLYQQSDLDPKIRQKAKECLYGFCLDNFSKGRVDNFHKTVREIIQLFGLQGLSLGIIVKYLISLVGTQNLSRLLALKNRLKNLPQNS
ncbi:glycosyltransferase [Spirulina subsalsa FACHB-351]|uniref:Glycosyltransferase n=1 Tax=Spirulina subsalsa FACHB-351 TaxID=234711 RepID=A0ABT3L613_9CYAN|nr:glycosyltransferase family 2 protein [Spirulina subsalsa]MCW6036950.1 glycosyltransferase [Spirulina subsalsa FACHB-351]